MVLGATAGSPTAFSRSYHCVPPRHVAASAISVTFGAGRLRLSHFRVLAARGQMARMPPHVQPVEPGRGHRRSHSERHDTGT
jgi:hypothetical protein